MHEAPQELLEVPCVGTDDLTRVSNRGAEGDIRLRRVCGKRQQSEPLKSVS